MDFPIIIIWTSPLSTLGESGIFFHFYFISYRNSCKQTIADSSQRLIMGKYCPEDNDFISDRFLFKLAGNKDRHKISDEFDFGPDWNIHFGVTRP